MDIPVPPQHMPQPIYDFRNAEHGPRGYKCANKRKLDEYQEQVCNLLHATWCNIRHLKVWVQLEICCNALATANCQKKTVKIHQRAPFLPVLIAYIRKSFLQRRGLFGLQVEAEQLATPMQTGEDPASSLPKRRKTNNVIGVGVVRLDFKDRHA